jgi:hypothetical protein
MLAQLLQERLGLRHVELDRLRHLQGGAAPDGEFAAALAAATRSDDTWVVEGAETTPPVTEAWGRADLVVWLDHRRSAITVRMVQDALAALVRGAPRGRLNYCVYQARKLRKSMRHLGAQRATRPAELARVRAVAPEVVRLRSRRATRRWLDDWVPGGGRGAL